MKGGEAFVESMFGTSLIRLYCSLSHSTNVIAVCHFRSKNQKEVHFLIYELQGPTRFKSHTIHYFFFEIPYITNHSTIYFTDYCYQILPVVVH
jgi:hypothetical protein